MIDYDFWFWFFYETNAFEIMTNQSEKSQSQFLIANVIIGTFSEI